MLEPIVELSLVIPTMAVGDVTGDLAGNRGVIIGTNAAPNNQTSLDAQAPLNELQDYSQRLRAITGGEGCFSMTLSHYEQAPMNVQKKGCVAIASLADQNPTLNNARQLIGCRALFCFISIG